MSGRDPHLVVFTGAGLSAESGLPTFRGGDGLWEGRHIDQVCNQLTWKRNVDAVHRFYNDRRAAAAKAQPNRAHRLLASWQDRYRCTLITQNVDDLLERAGAGDVMHVHGRLDRMRCEACGTAWEIGASSWGPYTGRCPKCASRRGVRPDVIFFHERAPRYLDMWRVVNSPRTEVRGFRLISRLTPAPFPARSLLAAESLTFPFPASYMAPCLVQRAQRAAPAVPAGDGVRGR